jgi:hypothetical protein
MASKEARKAGKGVLSVPLKPKTEKETKTGKAIQLKGVKAQRQEKLKSDFSDL